MQNFLSIWIYFILTVCSIFIRLTSVYSSNLQHRTLELRGKTIAIGAEKKRELCVKFLRAHIHIGIVLNVA